MCLNGYENTTWLRKWGDFLLDWVFMVSVCKMLALIETGPGEVCCDCFKHALPSTSRHFSFFPPYPT